VIPTTPSSRLADFIDFYRRIAGPAVDARVGASEEAIARFAALAGYPLPPLFVDYLREFGRHDGGLGLSLISDCSIEALIESCEDALRDPSARNPPRCVPITGEGLRGSWMLYYPSDAPPSVEPLVVNTYEDQIEAMAAESFLHYLYNCAFSRTHGIFTSADQGLMERIVACLASVGFASYWFSDAYQACLERPGQAVVVRQKTQEIVVYLHCASTASIDQARRELAELLGKQLNFQDRSPKC
jgi:hypothetical protein